MSNILLVEPGYRSKFPPLGLLRIGAYHKKEGDTVTFIRGNETAIREFSWHKIYVSSLFTYELPRTVKTLNFYRNCVDKNDDLIVGGIGATLFPEYIKEKSECRIITGPLDKPGILGREKRPVAFHTPDYDLIEKCGHSYQPEDSYFCRITMGCVRKCKFCAVPTLEGKFSYHQPLEDQINDVIKRYDEKRHLTLLDNNILACKEKLSEIFATIRDLGFQKNAVFQGKKRTVDFNQGIDARLITKDIAKELATINLSPVRLAFDHISMEKHYLKAIQYLSEQGIKIFTNYLMFNFDDTPEDFYYRMRLNVELSEKKGIRISGFPMKYIPINDIHRKYVSDKWYWRYIRGIQCVLQATHGVVSPNITFFEAAFGKNSDEFKEIISMPDRFIIYREKYKNGAALEWRKIFKGLSASGRHDFLNSLEIIHKSKNRIEEMNNYQSYEKLLFYYFLNGKIPKE